MGHVLNEQGVSGKESRQGSQIKEDSVVKRESDVSVSQGVMGLNQQGGLS